MLLCACFGIRLVIAFQYLLILYWHIPIFSFPCSPFFSSHTFICGMVSCLRNFLLSLLHLFWTTFFCLTCCNERCMSCSTVSNRILSCYCIYCSIPKSLAVGFDVKDIWTASMVVFTERNVNSHALQSSLILNLSSARNLTSKQIYYKRYAAISILCVEVRKQRPSG